MNRRTFLKAVGFAVVGLGAVAGCGNLLRVAKEKQQRGFNQLRDRVEEIANERFEVIEVWIGGVCPKPRPDYAFVNGKLLSMKSPSSAK